MKIIKIIIGFLGWLSYIGLLGAMTYLVSDPPKRVAAKQEIRLVRVTAFCPCEKCCGKWADGYTASGHKITAGDKFCAAPKNIPFGTMINIPGYGIVPVLDRGGAIKGDRLDVFFDDHQAALTWGVKFLKITVITKQ